MVRKVSPNQIYEDADVPGVLRTVLNTTGDDVIIYPQAAVPDTFASSTQDDESKVIFSKNITTDPDGMYIATLSVQGALDTEGDGIQGVAYVIKKVYSLQSGSASEDATQTILFADSIGTEVDDAQLFLQISGTDHVVVRAVGVLGWIINWTGTVAFEHALSFESGTSP